MENIITILTSALLSGAFTTIIMLWWQQRSQKRQAKVHIFTTLMSKRYDLAAEESVEALNMIDVVFYKDEKVRTAWIEFKNATELPETESKSQMIIDKHLRMLEVMAENIGYKKICWENIKRYYYPIGLSDRKRDEAILRRVQIDAGIAQIKREEEHKESAQVDPQAYIKNQLIFKAIENPESLVKLLEVAEKAQALNKTAK